MILIFILILILLIVATKSGGDDLLREYEQFLKVRKFRDQLISKVDKNKKYEFNNIIERFLLNKANGYDNAEIIKREMHEKNIKTDIKRELGQLNSNSHFRSPGKMRVRTIGNLTEYHYGLFYGQIYTDRRKMLGTNDKLILKMLMRYSTIVPGSQHWNIPGWIFKKLVEKYDIYIEGFASPFNSQLMKIKYERSVANCTLMTKDHYFCSVFEDPTGHLDLWAHFLTMILVMLEPLLIRLMCQIYCAAWPKNCT